MTVVRQYRHGSRIRLPDYNGAVPLGSSFRGWNTRRDGTGTEYKAGETFIANRDIVLHPMFSPMTREEIEGMRDALNKMLEGMERPGTVPSSIPTTSSSTT